jgi:hypothetical protein
VGLAHRGAWPGPANGFGPVTPFSPRWKQGKPKPVACRSISVGRRWAAGEGRVGVLSGAEGKPIGGADGEGAHRILAHDGDEGRRRGAPVRGRRSGGNPELKWCWCTLGRSGARGGRDGAGRWLERSVVGELVEEWRRRGTSDGSMGKWLRGPVVRATSTVGWRRSLGRQCRVQVADEGDWRRWGLGGRERQSTVVAGMRENEGEVGETVLCSTQCRDKVGTTWGGGHRRCAVTATSPLMVSCTGDWRKPFKWQLWLTSGPWPLSCFLRFSNTQTLKSEMVTFLMSKFCGSIVWNIRNNFSFWTNFKIPKDCKL